jgi:DNA replicative helicase MCM subunit Mcm2 (Cdc46/Mcm family)
MLESLIRLSEAHARMMFRKDIIIYDAISVVILMEHCINTGLFDENYPIVMSRQMYEKAKDEALTKLGLDPSYFSEEFDAYGERHPIKEQVNAMGEETRMNLDTSYYNGEKTEYTVDHRTYISSHNNQNVKNEIDLED